MLSILYEDNHIIVVIKPDGLESQSGKSFAPDMVSEIRKHLASHPQDIHKLTKETSTASKYPQPPYVGVIHRLDRPVSGIMVYAKNPKAAASLSTSLQQGKIEKWYQAVICGKPVDNNGTYVDYLKQDKKNNCSRIVDKSSYINQWTEELAKCGLFQKDLKMMYKEQIEAATIEVKRIEEENERILDKAGCCSESELYAKQQAYDKNFMTRTGVCVILLRNVIVESKKNAKECF